MKKPGIICILLSLLICLAACSGAQKAETAAASTEPATLPKVAIETETAPTQTAEPAETVPTEASPETLTEVPTTEAPTTEVPTTEVPTTESVPVDDPERDAFYDNFRELDPEKTDEWLISHNMLQNGYSRIYVNYSGIRDSGLNLYTKQGHQVVAIDVPNGILIIRTKLNNSNTVMAIAKKPERLHLYPAAHLGSYGERIASIASRNNGVLAMNGSCFDDPNGSGNGGTLEGYCMCGGTAYGSPMGWAFSRFELLESNWAIVTQAGGPASASTTDCVEFMPALIINGVKQSPGAWTDNQPRAAIGQNSHKDILMVVVEGRYRDSPGCAVNLIADLMLKYDGINAVNVDGGTTAIMWYRGQILNRCSNPNTPGGRYLPNAWVYK